MMTVTVDASKNAFESGANQQGHARSMERWAARNAVPAVIEKAHLKERRQ
jgi:hypothetical protein